jgi:hypothetical protein
MTTEQRNLILQAIGALKAALGQNTPQLPFTDGKEPEPEVADMTGRRKRTRDLLRHLYVVHGTAPIVWGTKDLKRLAFERDVKLTNYVLEAEAAGIVEVEREAHGQRSYIKSFRFIKAIK